MAEVGVCRLSGHKGPITDLAFMTQHPVLISASKDTFVKFWDLETQHCFKTLVGHRTEVGMNYLLLNHCKSFSNTKWKKSIKFRTTHNSKKVLLILVSSEKRFLQLFFFWRQVWSLALIRNEQYIVTGCGDAELRVWKISHRDADTENKTSIDQLAGQFQAAALEDSDDQTVRLHFKLKSS